MDRRQLVLLDSAGEPPPLTVIEIEVGGTCDTGTYPVKCPGVKMS